MICRQCGNRNPDDATFCSSCGASLRDQQDDQPTIITVSDDDSGVYVEERGGGQPFRGEYIGQARVYVARGGNRGCLIVVAAILLLICCTCIGWWAVTDSLF